jgi:hypothetical protein
VADREREETLGDSEVRSSARPKESREKRGTLMARVTGKITTNYFALFCEECNERTVNEYLGGDPGVPHFEATCKKCGRTSKWKFEAPHWTGLPYKVERNTSREQDRTSLSS